MCCLPATAWAAATVVDLWAQLGHGLGEGLRRVGMAAWRLLWHPLSTVEGMALALSDLRHGPEAWASALAHAWRGWATDPAGTAG
ncbi:MAG: hypothetical protein DWQ11_04075, partial [Proteobacteria bacterium]